MYSYADTGYIHTFPRENVVSLFNRKSGDTITADPFQESMNGS